MALEFSLVAFSISLILAPALAEFAKVRARAEKGFAWIAVGGVFFLLAAAFEAFGGFSSVAGYAGSLSVGSAIFGAIGLVSALIGALTTAMKILQ